MRCAVFRGIGGTANKYYLLFQHHLAPPISTFTTGKSPQGHICNFYSNIVKDSLQTTSDQGAGADPRQLENTFVLQEQSIDPSYIIGSKPGVSLLVASPRLGLILNSHTLRSTLGAYMPD
jgi:hypothetical protein